MSLAGKLIVFTGTLSMKRAEAKKKAEEAGAKVGGSITGKTELVIAGPDSGSKLDIATSKGIEIWDEDEFVEALDSKPAKGGKKKAPPAEAPPAKKAKKAAPAPKKKAKAEPGASDLEGKLVVFTGTLSIKRAEAKKLAEAAGAKVGGSITGKTDLVIAAPDSGSKLDVAESKGIEIWDEAQFMEAVGGEAPEEEEEEEEKPVKKPPAKKAKKEVVIPASPTPNTTSVANTPGGSKKADRSVPGGETYTVHEDYDVKLMQTNIDGGQNNNKFYIIQVLEKGGKYYCWNRWGRLGEEGKNNGNQCCGSEAAAVASFEKKFKDKTKNSWGVGRAGFVKHQGKYQLVETEGDDSGGDGCALGKLTKTQIEKGQGVLEEIEANLDNKKALPLLSSKFYSLIPTTSGRVQPPAINNADLLQSKQALLEFWLRMAFEDEVEETPENPLEGLKNVPMPATLAKASTGICGTGPVKAAITKAGPLQKKGAGGPVRAMDTERYGSILLYTGNAIYRALNQALRNKEKQVKKYFPYLKMLDDAMDCMPKQKITLWRGIAVDLFDSCPVGEVITWWSVSSCTADEKVARNFMNQLGGGCTLMTIKCNTAMDISCLSFYSNEKESLLAPGTQLKITNRTKKGKITEIHAEEVGNACDE